MPLGTLERSPPPFFKQGPSASSKLVVFSALALFLMVADVRLNLVQPLRTAVATVLYPFQWLVLQPVQAGRALFAHAESLRNAQARAAAAERELVVRGALAGQADELRLENARLRALLQLAQRPDTPGQAAQVLYDAADPYKRKVVIDRGTVHGVAAGSPVLDESGVLGQVTLAHPLASEVTLLTDRDQAIPVLNTRTGVRSVAQGQPGADGAELELRFMAGNADVQVGDLLSTSGVDGVYPPGLPVARVAQVERRAESAFARVQCTPLAHMNSTRHVWVLAPQPPAAEATAVGKGAQP